MKNKSRLFSQFAAVLTVIGFSASAVAYPRPTPSPSPTATPSGTPPPPVPVPSPTGTPGPTPPQQTTSYDGTTAPFVQSLSATVGIVNGTFKPAP